MPKLTKQDLQSTQARHANSKGVLLPCVFALVLQCVQIIHKDHQRPNKILVAINVPFKDVLKQLAMFIELRNEQSDALLVDIEGLSKGKLQLLLTIQNCKQEYDFVFTLAV